MSKRLSLSARLSIATGIFWLGFVILAALALHGLHSMSRDLQLVHDTHMRASQTAASLRQLIQDNRTEVLLAYQHAPDSPVVDVHDHPVDTHLKRLNERRARIAETWKALQALSSDAADDKAASTVGDAMAAWLTKSDATTAALTREDYGKQQLATFLLIGRNEGRALFDALTALEAHHLQAAARLYENARHTYQSMWGRWWPCWRWPLPPQPGWHGGVCTASSAACATPARFRPPLPMVSSPRLPPTHAATRSQPCSATCPACGTTWPR